MFGIVKLTEAIHGVSQQLRFIRYELQRMNDNKTSSSDEMDKRPWETRDDHLRRLQAYQTKGQKG